MTIPTCHISQHNGAPTIHVDGEPISSVAYFCTEPSVERIRSMRKAGVTLITWGVGGPVAHCNDIGLVGPDQYDYSHLDATARLILAEQPDAWLIPRIAATAPKWWLEAHPDQQAIMATGRPTGSGVGVGATWCADPRTTVVSQASDLWQQELESAIAHLIAHIDASDWGHRCIGLQPTGGENEWFVSHGSEFSDYGPLAVAAWHAWLRDHGVADTKQIEPPRPDELKRGTWGGYMDPAEGDRCQNWWRFFHELNATRMRQTCAAVKRASGDRLIAGAFYGYIGDSYSNGTPAAWLYGHHHNLREVCEDPAIDYLAAPFSYNNRQPGGTPDNQIPNAGVALTGTFTFTENDLGTFWSVKDESDAAITKSLHTMIRDQGQRIIRREGFWWMDLLRGENWYTHDILEQHIHRLTALQNEQAAKAPATWRPQVAVVLGNDTPFHHRVGYPLLADLVTFPLRNILPMMGLPIDVITLADLDRQDLPDYRLFCFLDAPCVTPEQRTAIQATLARRQAWAYWHGLPGLIDGASLDIAHTSALTGIELKLLGGGVQAGAGRRITARFCDFDHPLVADVPPSHTLGGAPADAIGFVADQDATIIGRQSLKGRPAVAVKETDAGFTSVYSSFPGAPPSFFRNLARAAGAHVFTDCDAVVDACDDLILVHQIGNAPVSLSVHGPATELIDRISGTRWPVNQGQVTLHGDACGHGRSHLLQLVPHT